jgi:trehalose 6-phosphate phosphatase
MIAGVEAGELVLSLRRDLPHALVALDFDGTLAPIVPDPQDSRIVPGGGEILIRLAQHGAQVAVITGRDVETVVRLGALASVPGLVVAGQYGMQWWRDGRVLHPDPPASIERLRAQLPAVVSRNCDDPRVWIEDKGLSLVVHTRRASDPAAAFAALRPAVDRLAGELGLETHPGREVIEVRPPGYDKGRALRELIADAQPSALLYAGDDRGDLPAFAAAQAARTDGGIRAWAVGVVSAEVPDLAKAVDVSVRSPAELVALLADIVA